MNKNINIYIISILNIFLLTCSNPTSSDDTPPSVAITSPQNNSVVSQIVNITCVATDNNSIKKVELWVNGKSTSIIDNNEPYSLPWNTTTFDDGTYTITVRAYDQDNNKTDSNSLTLIVDNLNSNPHKVNIISIEYTLTEMNIIWNQAIDNDFSYYELLQSETRQGNKNSLIQIFDISDTSYILSEFDPTHEMWYWISVTDSFGYSTSSDGYKILDSPPSMPTINQINYNNHSFNINWSKNENTDFQTYNLHESTKSDMSDKNLIFTSDNRDNNLYVVNDVSYNEIRYYQLTVKDYWELQTSSEIVSASSYPKIAYSCGGICIMDYDGSNSKAISSSFSDFEFSPDGLKITYTKSKSTQTDIWISDIDGNNNIALTNNQKRNFGQRFSPDGTAVVFVSDRNSKCEIYLMNIDGDNQRNLTNNPYHDYLPQFSPDGSKIIFTTDRDGNYEIYIMDLDGTNQINLTNNAFNDGVYGPITANAHGLNGISQFSPDGNRIIFTSNRDNNYELYIMNSDGSNPFNLTNNQAIDFMPRFSPDGSHIFFLSDRDGSINIYYMTSNGDNVINLTNGIDDINFYDLSTDGTTIVFSSINWIY